MKITGYLLVILMGGVLALAGCGKSNTPAPTARTPGRVELGDLLKAFPAPTAEISSSLDKLRIASRYRQFEASLVELDKLTRIPNLTDAQKKAIDEAIEQVKQAINLPAKPSQ